MHQYDEKRFRIRTDRALGTSYTRACCSLAVAASQVAIAISNHVWRHQMSKITRFTFSCWRKMSTVLDGQPKSTI